MTTLIQVPRSLTLQEWTLEVSLATNFALIDAAMRLRFEVFNLELQEGLCSSYDKGYDSDAYDAYCDHLIVKDLALGKVVGTYRLLKGSVARRNIGFYSENEFDLSKLKRLPGESLELGRSCVARSHRTPAVINLLWRAITHYALQHRAKYLFGCASLHCAAIVEVQLLYSYLFANYFAPGKYRVEPLVTCRLPINHEAGIGTDKCAVRRHLPPILKGYLRAGAMVCGPPAYDSEFGTADVFVLMEMDKMAARYRQHYFVETGG